MSYHDVAPAPQPSTLSPAEIEALIHQVLSKSTLNTAMSTTPGNSSWYIDYACCNHMTPNSSLFSTKFVLPRPTTIYTANGSHLDVSHIGSVSTHQLSMSDTYLVPNLSLNLLSVGQLCELGLELHFSKRGCDVHDPQTGQLIGTARKIGRLFELSSLHLPPTVSAATTSRSPSATLSLWHSRLGHAYVSRIRSLATSGQLGSIESESFDCVACQLMEIKAPLRRISFKYQLGRLREHEQKSSRMYSTDSFKSYGLKQIHGGPLSMIHVGNKESSP
jgi:hypothetical protein